MAMPFPYPAEVEKSMRILYLSLRENERRLYAAVEASKLGHGGSLYIADLLNCDPKTIRRGQRDLQQLQTQHDKDIAPSPRGRKKGVATSP